jgi:hypothetical protein
VFRLAAEPRPTVVLLALVFSEKKEEETELLGVVGTPHVKHAHSYKNVASTMTLHKMRGNPETQMTRSFALAIRTERESVHPARLA